MVLFCKAKHGVKESWSSGVVIQGFSGILPTERAFLAEFIYLFRLTGVHFHFFILTFFSFLR